MADDLTHKQALFVEGYIGPAKGNATKAARMAGYQGTNHSLEVTGSKLLRNGEVASRVQGRVAEVAMSADEVLELLAEVARLPTEYFATLGRDAKMTMGDKVRALELLGKYHKLWVDKTVDVNLNAKALIGVDLDRL